MEKTELFRDVYSEYGIKVEESKTFTIPRRATSPGMNSNI